MIKKALLSVAVFLLAWLPAISNQAPAQLQGEPAAPQSHFHHLHLNATDPAAAVKFYTTKFDSERARFGGSDAVWAQRSWILFNKVRQAPPWELTSAVWHFGWGAEDMKATYQKQLDSGTKFFTPLTDISEFTRTPGFYYAYVDGPDHALIELNTANHHRFGHIHLFSADAVTAGEFYMKYFGAARRSAAPPSREPRFFRGIQVGPSMSLLIDNVNLIIYPIEYSRQVYPDHWKKSPPSISPTRGRVVDHIAFSFDNLDQVVERMRKDGVKIVEGARVDPRTKIKHAFIEGPDNISIEMVEGHARKE